jgi:hypothetical protein
LLVLGLLIKVLLEEAWFYPVVWNPGSNMSVVQAAHLGGVFWGGLMGLAWGFKRVRLSTRALPGPGSPGVA